MAKISSKFIVQKKVSHCRGSSYEPINHEDFVYALSHIDTFVDIDEKDLLKIYALATKRHAQNKLAGAITTK